MTPYYEADGIAIFHGDWRDNLEVFRDADCVVADPPYGETSLEWDRWPDGWPAVLASAVRPNTSMWCFGSARMFLAHASEFGAWRFVQDVVWEKQNGSGFMADRFKRVHESVYQFVQSGAVWGDVFKCAQFDGRDRRPQLIRRGKTPHLSGDGNNGLIEGQRLSRSVLFAPNCHGFAENETQKPETLVGLLARFSCPVGGLILSPFMGSGTDLVVAKAHGMRAIGFDLREQQCEVAARRLAQGVLSFAEVA